MWVNYKNVLWVTNICSCKLPFPSKCNKQFFLLVHTLLSDSVCPISECHTKGYKLYKKLSYYREKANLASIYCVVQKAFRYVELFGMVHESGRWTDQ